MSSWKLGSRQLLIKEPKELLQELGLTGAKSPKGSRRATSLDIQSVLEEGMVGNSESLWAF